jgi:hypothetical protein
VYYWLGCADHVEMGPMRAIAIAASGCILLAACSPAAHSPAGHSSTPTPAPVPSSSSSSDAVPNYLNAVNTLCDGLEQKIVALNGGKFDIPLKDYLAQLPRHTKLIDDFDHQLAAIDVPQAAQAKARALAAYIVFADKLDAARLRTARQGAAAYRREIDAEKKTAASDPSIAALGTAGFSQSCTAR